MSKTIIIQSSARSHGNTKLAANVLRDLMKADLIDLNEFEIGQFDYEFKNSEDDFLPLIERIIRNYDTLIFATPVYWYSMSGHLKVFLDRISDLLYNNKELGKKLNGKNIGVISNSSGKALHPSFIMPFSETSKYLKMNFIGHVHTWVEKNKEFSEEVRQNIKQLALKIPVSKV